MANIDIDVEDMMLEYKKLASFLCELDTEYEEL